VGHLLCHFLNKQIPMSAFDGGLNGWAQHFIFKGKDGVDSYEAGTAPWF
jgi:hypothetical protein